MSKRRELQEHSDSLSDIGELLGAMKNLALVESRRIATFIEAQRAAAGIVESTLADFISDYANHVTPTEPDGEVVCIIGSERGFCGDLNQRLFAAAEEIIAVKGPAANAELDTGLRRHVRPDRNPEPQPGAEQSAQAVTRPDTGNEAVCRVVLVGSRLADAWSGDAVGSIQGANFADEVQNVLADLIATLGQLVQTGIRHNAPALSLIYFTEAGPVHHALLPAPATSPDGMHRSHPLGLNLTPRQFHAALIDQFLESALGCALYDALLYENQLRLEHMEHARHRVDQQRDDLARRINRARQEEITEEIEIIMLSSIATDAG